MPVDGSNDAARMGGMAARTSETVVVVGGGNVAFDVARSAVRVPGAYRADAHDFYEAADSSRMALRSGAKEVHLVCLESRAEMPADEAKLLAAMKRGQELSVTGTSARGTLTRDNYSLAGLSAALGARFARCGAITTAAPPPEEAPARGAARRWASCAAIIRMSKNSFTPRITAT